VRIAIPTLQHASDSNVLFDECEVVVSILAAMAAKRGEDTTMFHNMIYGDTEPASTSRFVWRLLKVNPDVERDLFSDPMYPSMESQLDVWNTSFVEESVRLVTQDVLSVTNPAYKDELYLRRLFDAVVPWTKMDVNFDTHAALSHADRLGLSHFDQHMPLSNDGNVSNKAHLEYYQTHEKTMKTYPECFTVRDNDAFNRKWKQLEKHRPKLFRASTNMQIMKDRQAKRYNISQDCEFQERRSHKMQRLVHRDEELASSTDDEHGSDDGDDDGPVSMSQQSGMRSPPRADSDEDDGGDADDGESRSYYDRQRGLEQEEDEDEEECMQAHAASLFHRQQQSVCNY